MRAWTELKHFVVKLKTGNQEHSDESGSSEESSSDDSAVYAKRYDKGLLEVFAKIKRNEPDRYPLDTKLKPFIPDYIPAVGEVDAFLKIPRPDKKEENLGYVFLLETFFVTFFCPCRSSFESFFNFFKRYRFGMLDEPKIDQSDPTALDFQLRAHATHSVYDFYHVFDTGHKFKRFAKTYEILD